MLVIKESIFKEEKCSDQIVSLYEKVFCLKEILDVNGMYVIGLKKIQGCCLCQGSLVEFLVYEVICCEDLVFLQRL